MSAPSCTPLFAPPPVSVTVSRMQVPEMCNSRDSRVGDPLAASAASRLAAGRVCVSHQSLTGCEHFINLSCSSVRNDRLRSND